MAATSGTVSAKRALIRSQAAVIAADFPAAVAVVTGLAAAVAAAAEIAVALAAVIAAARVPAVAVALVLRAAEAAAAAVIAAAAECPLRWSAKAPVL